jgi:RNA polymerase sigma-70 factor (TIGR02943 family)
MASVEEIIVMKIIVMRSWIQNASERNRRKSLDENSANTKIRVALAEQRKGHPQMDENDIQTKIQDRNLVSTIFTRFKIPAMANQEYLKEWVASYTDDLYSWAYYKTSSKETAQDLVQDTFLVATESPGSFEGKSNPRTWLFSILNNKIVDHYRKKGKSVLIQEETPDNARGPVLDALFDDQDEWRSDARPQAWNTEEQHLLDNPDFNLVLQDCLNRLPAKWTSAICFKYLEEKEGEKICQELEISATNFWQLIHRAKLQLRQCLEHHWFKKAGR